MGSQNDKTFLDLWASLYRTRDFLYELRKKELSKIGLSPGQSGVMWAISQSNYKADNQDIARLTFRKRHSIYEMIARMEKLGLVEKEVENSGKISDKISLTKEGMELWKSSRKEGFITKIFSVLSDKECKQLKNCLEKLQNEAIKHLSTEGAPLPRL